MSRKRLPPCLSSPFAGAPSMFRFLQDLLAHPGTARTVIVMEPDSMSTPRQYEVRPGYALYAAAIGVVLLASIVVALLVVTPLRDRLGGASAAELRTLAETNATRAAALEDSLTVQTEQIDILRALITGGVAAADSTLEAAGGSAPPPPEGPSAPAAEATDAEQTPSVAAAVPPGPLPMRLLARGNARAAEAYLGHLRVPALPPLDGVVSRGFDPPFGHFGLDVAVAEGTPVRALGDGYVVFADWTHAGGYVVAVQHPDGYLSIYKHVSRLLQRVGERVRTRDVIALSGNTGASTSGPHLHLELWRDGLAQDPAAFLVRP